MNRRLRIGFIASGVIMGGCCLGGVLILQVLGSSAKNDLATEEQLARQAGMPLEIADLEIPKSDPARNAAGLYEKVRGLAGEDEFKRASGIVNLGSRSKATSTEIAEADEALKTLDPEFKLLEELPRYPDCAFKRDWSQGVMLSFPEHSEMKREVLDLAFRADSQDRNRGPQRALKSLALGYRISDDAGREPTVIAGLLQVACRAIVGREMEKLVARHSREDKFLNQAEALVRRYTALPDERKYLSGEAVFTRLAIRAARSLPELGLGNGPMGFENNPPDPPERLIFLTDYLRNRIEAGMTETWRKEWAYFPADSQDWQGFEDASQKTSRWIEKSHSRLNLVNQMLFPHFNNPPLAMGTLQARERLLLSSIEILKQRNALGTFPQSLPKSLGKIGIDPFDGQPLRYRLKDHGFLLYSIGKDREDNGGTPRGSGASSDRPYDEVMEFSVR